MKVVKESYDTFYGKTQNMNFLFKFYLFLILAKGFKTIIRSCASRSTLGVAQGCRYFIDEVGLEVAVCVSNLESNLVIKAKSSNYINSF